MPSTLLVPITKIESIKPHPNADKLEIAEVLGWQTVIQKDTFKVGDEVLYIPPDAVLPVELSDRFGVTQYLSKQRVKQVKLRGEPSFGFVIPVLTAFGMVIKGLVNDQDNYADYFGITKYEPPIKIAAGDAAPERADFPKYTGIENLRNFPKILEDGEPVVITEKIHGTNCRVGIISGELVAGSHGVNRRPPQHPDGKPLDFADALYSHNIYWSPFALESVRNLLNHLSANFTQVVLYGEVYGKKIQDLDYGKTKSELGFAAFDVMIDGIFLPFMSFKDHCEQFGVPIAPVLAFTNYSLDEVKKHAGGKTTLIADHIREGVVVKPLDERTDPKIGRVVMKYLSDEYLFSDTSDSKDI